jgi:hypothetical protein
MTELVLQVDNNLAARFKKISLQRFQGDDSLAFEGSSDFCVQDLTRIRGMIIFQINFETGKEQSCLSACYIVALEFPPAMSTNERPIKKVKLLLPLYERRFQTNLDAREQKESGSISQGLDGSGSSFWYSNAQKICEHFFLRVNFGRFDDLLIHSQG